MTKKQPAINMIATGLENKTKVLPLLMVKAWRAVLSSGRARIKAITKGKIGKPRSRNINP